MICSVAQQSRTARCSCQPDAALVEDKQDITLGSSYSQCRRGLSCIITRLAVIKQISQPKDTLGEAPKLATACVVVVVPAATDTSCEGHWNSWVRDLRQTTQRHLHGQGSSCLKSRQDRQQ